MARLFPLIFACQIKALKWLQNEWCRGGVNLKITIPKCVAALGDSQNPCTPAVADKKQFDHGLYLFIPNVTIVSHQSSQIHYNIYLRSSIRFEPYAGIMSGLALWKASKSAFDCGKNSHQTNASSPTGMVGLLAFGLLGVRQRFDFCAFSSEPARNRQ